MAAAMAAAAAAVVAVSSPSLSRLEAGRRGFQVLQVQAVPSVRRASGRAKSRVRVGTSCVLEAPPTLGKEAADYCGDDGHVMDRPSIKAIEPRHAKGDKKYFIHTFGCQMNLADSERMAGVLEAMGYSSSLDPEEADVVVCNTCSIRDKAEQKVYSYMGRQVARKRADPNIKLVVAGCVAQQEGERLLRRVPELDIVMGPQHANRLHELLEQADLGSQVCAVDPAHILEDIAVPRRDSQITAWVNIIYGCNERCSYCVVPSTRGVEQSREPEAIKREVLSLAEAGYKEITLLGQNIDAYGRDLPGTAADGSGRRRWTLTDLLHYVCDDLTGIQRVRFATSHPRYFTERLIKACAEIPLVCKHFHIPFQSGDNDILKEMKRGYTHQQYRKIIDTIRRYMPDASVSADAIVGFPGETEEQFQNTLRLVEDVGFDICNTAAYSPRPNTLAALWDNQVAELIKSDRLQRLNEAVSASAASRTTRYFGREELVLVEDVNPKLPEQVMGRTDGNRIAYFPGGSELVGKMVKVKITEVRSFSISGELVEVIG